MPPILYDTMIIKNHLLNSLHISSNSKCKLRGQKDIPIANSSIKNSKKCQKNKQNLKLESHKTRVKSKDF